MRRRGRKTTEAVFVVGMVHSDVSDLLGFVVRNTDKFGHGPGLDRMIMAMKPRTDAHTKALIDTATKVGFIELDVVEMVWTPTPYGRHMHNAWSVG